MKRSRKSRQLPKHLDADKALSAYLKDPEWLSKTGVGGLINSLVVVVAMLSGGILAPVSLALMGLTSGYVMRVMRLKSLSMDSKLPPWDDWMELFVSGVTWIAVQFGLTTIVVSVGTIAYLISAAVFKAQPGAFMGVLFGGVICFLVTGLAMHLMASYLMVNFALEEKLGAGFDIRRVCRAIARRPKDLLAAWLLSLGFQFAGFVLPALTILGIFIVPTTAFAAQLAGGIMLVHAWELVHKELDEPPESKEIEKTADKKDDKAKTETKAKSKGKKK